MHEPANLARPRQGTVKHTARISSDFFSNFQGDTSPELAKFGPPNTELVQKKNPISLEHNWQLFATITY